VEDAVRTIRFRASTVDVNVPNSHISSAKKAPRVKSDLIWLGLVLFLAAPLHLSGQQSSSGNNVMPSAAPNRAVFIENYGKLPLDFEANQGQTQPAVRFLARGDGYTLFLTDSAAVLALTKHSTQFTPNRRIGRGMSPAALGRTRKADVVQMELAGASPDTHVSGIEQLAGTANYFIGSNPTHWHSNVPTYARVEYASVYPGVDLVYYGNQRQLEFDFVVAAGSSPKLIRLRFAGVNELKLDPDGDLTIVAKNGKIAFHKPVIYQTINGQRHIVDGKFSLLGGNAIGFSLGDYDRQRAVVIDPALAYSTYLGGSTGSTGTAIAVDKSGSAYVTGATADANFPVTKGVFQSENRAGAGVLNAFVTKLNPAGTHLVFSTYLGGTGDGIGDGDQAMAIAVDASGNSYVTGYAYSSNFPLKNPYQSTNKGAPNNLSNPFVTKLNPTGTALIYSTYLGGSSNVNGIDQGDRALGIAVNADGNAFVVGSTYSTDFPVTSRAYQSVDKAAPLDSPNAFVTQFDPAGTSLVYSTYLGGTGITTPCCYWGDGARGIAVDTAGNAYVSGEAASLDFPVTPGAFQPTNHGEANQADNGFISKLNSAGSELIYSTYLGGSSAVTDQSCFYCSRGDGIAGIAIDTAGNAYVAGGTYSKNFPITSKAFQKVNHAAPKLAPTGFVSEINPTGTELIYSTFLGGSGALGDVAYGIALDSSGNAYLNGFTSSVDFPITANAFQSVNKAAENRAASTFVAEINPTGSRLVYSTFLGGSGYHNGDGTYTGDYGYGIALDSAGSAYVTGSASSPDFPVTTGGFQTKERAPVNAYVAKISQASSPKAATPVFSPVAGTYDSPQSVTITDATTGATVYYTTNGKTPTTSSAKYTAAIKVSVTETIEAIAVATGYTNSAVASAEYTIK